MNSTKTALVLTSSQSCTSVPGVSGVPSSSRRASYVQVCQVCQVYPRPHVEPFMYKCARCVRCALVLTLSQSCTSVPGVLSSSRRAIHVQVCQVCQVCLRPHVEPVQCRQLVELRRRHARVASKVERVAAALKQRRNDVSKND